MKKEDLYEEEYKDINEDDDDSVEIGGVSITSVDILQQKFRLKFRGYDSQDVDVFLELVAKEMERLSNENSHMEREIGSLRRAVEKYKKKEESINAALLTVQIMSDDMKNNAAKEAERTVANANTEAENTVSKANREAENTLAAAKREAENTIYNSKREADSKLAAAKKESEELLKETQENKKSINREMELLIKEKEQEAQKIIEDATAKADIIRQEIDYQKGKIQEEINVLKQKKNHLYSSLKSQIETHLKLLESEQD